MKKQTVNNFSKGLVTDLNPLNTPQDVLVEARNVDFITTSGDQIILQKRAGNDPETYEDTSVTLTSGFKPLSLKEVNNVVYIISHNESTGEGEIGTFPSPDYSGFVWKPVGDPLVGTVSAQTPTFDSGLKYESIFEVEPSTFDDDYAAVSSATEYTFIVSNNGVAEDTYRISYPTEVFTCAIPVITVIHQQVGEFILTLKTSEQVYHDDVTVVITSEQDSSSKVTIEWDSISVYNTGTSYPPYNDYFTVSSASEYNIDEATAVEDTKYGTLLVNTILNPNDIPYFFFVRLNTSTAAGNEHWRVHVDQKYIDNGTVTIEDTGWGDDFNPSAVITRIIVHRSGKFEILLPTAAQLIARIGGSINIIEVEVITGIVGGSEYIVSFKGDTYYNNFEGQSDAFISTIDPNADPGGEWYWYDQNI